MKKLGLFVTGHFRGGPKTRENYAQFLDGYDTSVFVSSWSNKDINRYDHSIDWAPIDVEGMAKQAFGDSLKDMWVGDFRKFMNNEQCALNAPPRLLWNDWISPENDPLRSIYPNPQRSLDQWYAVFQSYLLAEDVYDTFDLVVRIRGDLIFLGKPKLPLDDPADGIHVNGYTWWHNPRDRDGGQWVDGTNLTPYALSDHLAWAKPHWMRKYFEYYLNWGKLYPGKLNIWCGGPRDKFEKPDSLLYNTEHMMAYYLLRFPYYHYSPEYDMPWTRHGHDDDPGNRFNSDYYCWGH